MYCVSQLRAFPSYGHCLNLHCPDKGGLTVQLGRQECVFDNISKVANNGVSGFSGMGIVEWWNSGMVEWWNGCMCCIKYIFGACWQ